MIKIAICDDEKIFVDMVHKNLNFIFDDLSVEIDIYDFCDPVLLLNSFPKNIYDAIFLDIDMPISGFDIAKELRKISYVTQIIFITSKHSLVYDSFDYQPFYFICKRTPELLRSDLTHVAEKLFSLHQQHKKLSIIDVSIGSLSISLSEIMYIKSEKHYLYYYRTDGSSPIKERRTLNSVYAEISDCNFIKPHQRYLVNMHHISCFDYLINTITMLNGDNIPISKRLKQDVFEQYRVFTRR